MTEWKLLEEWCQKSSDFIPLPHISSGDEVSVETENPVDDEIEHARIDTMSSDLEDAIEMIEDRGDVISGFTSDYRFLSNFYASRIEIWGWIFPTAEHAYQAAKSTNKDHWARILDSNDPRHAKRIGRRAPALREDWEKIKVDVMTDVVMAKFDQNPKLREKLLATGDAYLEEENDWGDTFWGTCNSVGLNQLGGILMYVRENMK